MVGMSSVTAKTNGVSDKHHVNVVLRLLLDQRWRLITGDLVLGDGTIGTRFKNWHQLERVLKDWIDDQQVDS
jgi:hypothetical protein